MKLVIFADGGSRGNPGIAGSGTAVYTADRKTLLKEIAYVVGTKSTNNVAEYHGLLRGLEAALELGASEVEFYMDSKLVVEQMNGRWKIKHPDMKELALKARALIDRLDVFELSWVPRAQNKVADALSNVAMDAAAKGEPVGIVCRGEDPKEPKTPEKPEKSEESEAARPEANTAAVSAPSEWVEDSGAVTRIFLLRHGQTPMSAAKQYSGHSDPSLSEVGHRQALAAAQALAGVEFDAILSSPLRRCQETAAAVANGRDIDVETRADLIELDFGLWEGKTFDEAHSAYPDLHSQWLEDTSVACPGGESLQALHRRVRAARQDLQARYTGKTIAVVTHVNPIKSFVRQALDAGPVTFNRLFLDLASITEMEFWEQGSVLRRFNDVGHLGALS
ncbi:bifunctional RNase H/acid phosphatase [Corynebacterium sp.]|uniref:bifunctional RNase H/acid phosphatase n=1 Tax=Corynebacterium sp. TaxID=1720 RepID=UPI0026DD649A|nr:bifunctional RNase H/acid phosphatase [Corynebacterium sp.]MDO5031318.1 bifunctional RNase H/acid phosphatase [Corynebacterium sp.]